MSLPVLSACICCRSTLAAGGRGDVDVLPADHAAARRWRAAISARMATFSSSVPCLALQDERERLGEQGVAGQDGDVLAEDHVAGRLAAPQVVVVDGRQVVVDEGVGVDELEGGRCRQRRRQRPPETLDHGEREHGTDPLAAGQQRVPHGLAQPVHGSSGAEARSPRNPSTSARRCSG